MSEVFNKVWGRSSTGFVRSGEDGKGYAVASVYGSCGNPLDDETMEKNTNLIAASPQIYSALSDLLSSIKSVGGSAVIDHLKPEIDFAEKALRKARGEKNE